MMWLWMLLGILVIVATVLAYTVFDLMRYSLGRGLLSVTPTLLLYLCFHRAKRYAALMESAEKHPLAEDSRPPVVYLRSFVEDNNAGITVLDPETQEELLASVFRKAGPFVALGMPTEQLPTLGASRIYVDDEWEKAITNLMSRARMVVLRTGKTQSLLWELGWAMRHLRPEQLLLIVPSSRKSYRAFCHQAQSLFPLPLPEYPVWKASCKGLKGIICFDQDWRARFITFKWSFLRGSLMNPLPRALQVALRPTFERLGIPWLPPGINWIRLFFLSLVMLLILYDYTMGSATA